MRQPLRRLARADADERREEERPASGSDERGEGDEKRRDGRRERRLRFGVFGSALVVFSGGRRDRDAARELEIGVLGRASRDARLLVDDVVVSRSSSRGEERLAQRRGVVGRRHRGGAGRTDDESLESPPLRAPALGTAESETTVDPSEQWRGAIATRRARDTRTMDAIMKADYGDAAQKAVNDAASKSVAQVRLPPDDSTPARRPRASVDRTRTLVGDIRESKSNAAAQLLSRSTRPDSRVLLPPHPSRPTLDEQRRERARAPDIPRAEDKPFRPPFWDSKAYGEPYGDFNRAPKPKPVVFVERAPAGVPTTDLKGQPMRARDRAAIASEKASLAAAKHVRRRETREKRAEERREDPPYARYVAVGAEARSIHWSPYDRVRVVNADP